MAKLFIGLALAIMLGSAALSFLAKGNIDKMKSRLTEATNEKSAAEAKVNKAQTEAKKAQEDLTAANTKAEEAAKEAEAKGKAADEAARRETEAKALASEKDVRIAALEKQLADNVNKPPQAPVQDDPRLTELTLEAQKAKTDLEEAKVLRDNYKKQLDEAQSKLSASEQREKLRSQNVTRAGLTGRILAVNSGWNFVVLSVGDKQGVTMNAPLLVVRGNEPIARLRITSVEPSTSIADLIPSSVRKGTSIQPGDTVIFEGGRTTAPAKTAGAEGEASLPAN